MWYIDSWAVFDGLAFASERKADSLEATATVFLSVPDLEPVPVGRISTALRAQRAAFQDGFRDDGGRELGLGTLEQVRELIRRAYLGGGLGPTPMPLERPTDPLLVEPGRRQLKYHLPSDGGSHYRAALEHQHPRGRSDLQTLEFSSLRFPHSRRKLLEGLHTSRDALALYPLLRAFGEATVLEFLDAFHDRLNRPDHRELLREWIYTLWAIGLWDSLEEGSTFFENLERQAPNVGLVVGRLYGDWIQVALRASPMAVNKEILFRIPCPLLNHWDRHIRTLSHKLLLPVVDREYFSLNKDLAEFIPLLFCSLVIASSPRLLVAASSSLQDDDRLRLLGHALLWLVNELPTVDLPSEVEEYLTRFAREQLTKNPERGA